MSASGISAIEVAPLEYNETGYELAFVFQSAKRGGEKKFEKQYSNNPFHKSWKTYFRKSINFAVSIFMYNIVFFHWN